MPGNRCSNCIAYNLDCTYVEAAKVGHQFPHPPSLSTPVKWTRYVCATCQYSFRHCYSPMPIVACFRHTLRMNLPIRTSGEMEFVSIAILSATVQTDSRAVVATLYAANPISSLSARPCPLTLNRCADASLRRNVVHLKGTFRLCRSCCQSESGRQCSYARFGQLRREFGEQTREDGGSPKSGINSP